MPLPVITNVVRCAVKGVNPNGQPWVNVLHFIHGAGAPSASDITALDGIVRKLYNGPAFTTGTGFWKTYANNLASTLSYTYTPLDGASASTIISHNDGGLIATDPLPDGVALVVSFRTGFRGRMSRGRNFWSSMCETQNASPGIPTTAMVADILVQWQGLQTALAAAGWSHVVASYKFTTSTVVTSYIVPQTWATQRRRMK